MSGFTTDNLQPHPSPISEDHTRCTNPACRCRATYCQHSIKRYDVPCCDQCSHQLHTCGYPNDSFACRIRHQGQPIIGWGRAAKSW